MKFFGKRKPKRPAAEKREKPVPLEKKEAGPERKPVAAVPSGEKQRAKAMAAKAAKWKPFIDACKATGLKNPQQAFLDYYKLVKDDPTIWTLEARMEAQVEEKGKRFSRTGFYASLFIDRIKRAKG